MQKRRSWVCESSTVGWLLLLSVLMGGIHGISGYGYPADERRRHQLLIHELNEEIVELRSRVAETEENAELRTRIAKAEERLGRCNLLQVGHIQRCIKNMEAILKENPSSKYRGREAEQALARCEALDHTDEFGNTALHRAVLGEDEQSIQIIVGSLGADTNAQNEHLETPIMLAAAAIKNLTASMRIVKYLGEHGANLLAADGTGQTFLHKLVSRQDLFTTAGAFQDLEQYIIAKENATKLFNIQDKVDRRTPLMLALKSGEMDSDMLSLLRSKGVDFTKRDKDGRTALSYYVEGTTTAVRKYANLTEAIEAGDEDAVKTLVILRADLNSKHGLLSETVLHKAGAVKDKAFAVKTIKFLIQHGADPYAVDRRSSTFLHHLVDDGEVKLSPSQFHDITAFLVSGYTSPIFYGRERVVKHLKLPRASWTFSQSTPLHLAVKQMEVQNGTLSLLKNEGIDFNFGNDDEETLLFYAVAGGRSTRLLADLVAHGADPKHMNKWGDSLLHWSALMGNVEQLKFFLDLGELDINAKDKRNGRTPLHRAVFNGKGDVLGKVRLLIENGANVKTKHRWGESPLDSALKSGNLADKDEIVKLLRDKSNKKY